MDIRVYDSNVKEIALIDNYISLIWTDRYIGCGDFTLDLKASNKNLSIFAIGNYLRIRYSRHTMLIETINLTQDDDGTSKLTVSGRSVECVLEKRIYIPKYTSQDPKKHYAFKIMTENLETAGFPGELNLDNFNPATSAMVHYYNASEYAWNAVSDIVADPKTYETVADYTDCYSEMIDLCTQKHVGFRFDFTSTPTIDSKGNLYYFHFVFYNGEDRSLNSTKPIVLSHRYDTLTSSEFVKSTKNRISDVLVFKVLRYTSTSGSSKTHQLLYRYKVPGLPHTGINRKDAILDMTNKADKDTEGNDIPYIVNGVLAENANDLFAPYAETEAKKAVAQSQITELYSGEIEPKAFGLMYLTDYYLGDIVEFENVFNAYSKCRITEVVISSDNTGDTIYPTFSSLVDEIVE